MTQRVPVDTVGEKSAAITVAALYVETNGVYFGLPDVDPWDEARDARLYAGPHPVVAHPPCSTWCQLAKVNEARYGHRVGDDGGCFRAALRAVQRWGGVLEHPADTHAWPRFGLTKPRGAGWQRDFYGAGLMPAWVCEVSQAAYGHRARKLTWLYYVGERPPAPMDWRVLEGEAWCGNDGSENAKPQLSKREAKASPIAFRDALIALARTARGGLT